MRERRLTDAKSVAAGLALPLATLYDLARDRKVPGAIRIGRRLVFDLDTLEPWLDAGGHLAPPDASQM